MRTDIILNDELIQLIQPLSAQDLENLTLNMFDNGCTRKILLWKGTLIDGYHEFMICREFDILFETVELELDSFEDAAIKLCRYQLGREDLTLERKKYLIGKILEYQKQAQDKIYYKLAQCHQHPINNSFKTLSYLANELCGHFNIGSGTVLKYHLYAVALDTIKESCPIAFERILAGEIKVSHENVIEISHYSQEEIKKLENLFTSPDVNRVGFNEIRHELSWKRYEAQFKTSGPKKLPQDTVDAKIKMMPEYDPDAEVTSLSFTIPSWIKFLSKVQEKADLDKISPNARDHLIQQLFALTASIRNLQLNMKEVRHE